MKATGLARALAATGLPAVFLIGALAGCGASSGKATAGTTTPTTLTPTTGVASRSSSPPPRSGTSVAASSRTTFPSPATTTRTAARATAPTSAAPSRPDYSAARAQWIGDGLVGSSALQNTALEIAVLDLKNGQSADPGNKSGYAAAIAAIENFENLPLTSVTPAEDAEGQADFKVVNTFFDLPVSTYVPSCSDDPGSPAATAWSDEPANTTSGLLLVPLERAAANLEQGVSTNSCFPAAIADLQSLESATRGDILASSAETSGRGFNLYGAEIAYLSDLFGTDVLTASR
jgi:hypothetical protein